MSHVLNNHYESYTYQNGVSYLSQTEHTTSNKKSIAS